MRDEDEPSVTRTEPLEIGDVEVELEGRAAEEEGERAELSAIARLGRYELLGRIAVGGMAEIHLARERFRSLGSRELVVKVMRLELEGQADFHQMFLNESQVALRLQHPNICHVYECGIEQGRCFIAMEHVRGVTWRELQKRAAIVGVRPKAAVLVKIAAQVADALHSAHHTKDAVGRPLNVVHRDVSPQNVMVGFDGVVKLLDFGVAHARTERVFERSGTIQGKFGYLAPEQCLGRPVDARADVFALGVCLWEALTGRRLYRRVGDYETLNAIVQEDAPCPNAQGAEVPEPLAAIVRRALARNPADRFQTAADMQHALERFLTDAGEMVTAGRVAELVTHLAGDAREGPELDRRPAVVAWIGPDAGEVAPPARGRRLAMGIGALAVAGALSALALVQGGEEPPPVERQVATPAPPPLTPSEAPRETIAAAPTEVYECPSVDVPGVSCVVPAREPEVQAPRRRPPPGGFVDDPGF